MSRKTIVIFILVSIAISSCSVIDRFRKNEPTPTSAVINPPPPTIEPYPQPSAYPPPFPQPSAYPPPLMVEPSLEPQPYPAPDQPINSQQPVMSGSSASPLEPLPNEENLQRGQVFIEMAEISVPESAPATAILHLKGSLPTPCHHLRAEVSKPDAENRIMVKIYSLVDPNLVCMQVIQSFDSQFSLGKYKSGNYTVWINGEKIGKFSL